MSPGPADSRIGSGRPYPQLNIAEAGPWAPIESPSLFWVPHNLKSRVPWWIPHVVAHQWFYDARPADNAGYVPSIPTGVA